MLKLDLQFFASKKGVGSTKTVVILLRNVLVQNVLTANLLQVDPFFTANVEQKFTQVKM